MKVSFAHIAGVLKYYNATILRAHRIKMNFKSSIHFNSIMPCVYKMVKHTLKILRQMLQGF